MDSVASLMKTFAYAWKQIIRAILRTQTKPGLFGGLEARSTTNSSTTTRALSRRIPSWITLCRRPKRHPRSTLSTWRRSPKTSFGSKGTGEARAETAPVAIINAVSDALDPTGVEITSLPLDAQRIWLLLRDAEDEIE